MISGYDSLTEPMSKCFDYFIKPCFLHFLLMFQPTDIRAHRTDIKHTYSQATQTLSKYQNLK